MTAAASSSSSPPRFIIIGAGQRGRTYARAIHEDAKAIVAAVAEPLRSRRDTLGKLYIWGPGPGPGHSSDSVSDSNPGEGQSFSHWRDFLAYELDRRARAASDEHGLVPPGVDGAFVAVLDAMHRDVVVGLAPLGIHIMCEKPLAPSLPACLDMYAALRPLAHARVFSVGHVLRYSPHNVLLRKLLVEDKVIGEVSSVVHTEPVGWWHFSHSFVRGNWRSARTTGPSLLTKCCHDVDFLMWLLCYPDADAEARREPHLPASVTSTGGVQFFRRERKPAAAGAATTNCMRCPLRDAGCKYSAKGIYLGPRPSGVDAGNVDWPVSAVVPDIEELDTPAARRAAVTRALEEDWDASSTPEREVMSRNWFGRCVFEADNDVCDEQVVTMTWPAVPAVPGGRPGRPAKRATLHMVSQTVKQCDRYSYFYGEDGEMYADSQTITVEVFATGERRTYTPRQDRSGHGGGDVGLTVQFVAACDRVKNEGWGAERAQREFVGCTLEDVLRSHGMVFAAEEARVGEKVVRWGDWWGRMMESCPLPLPLPLPL